MSNHTPDVLSQALDDLEADGIDVTRVGQAHRARRVTAEDFDDHDAIVTIGKSVQYSLRAHVPVFCFDHFGGPGWLTVDTFAPALAMNFSGRTASGTPPQISSDTPKVLTQKITSGFADAWRFSQSLKDTDLALFAWEHHIATLIDLARTPPNEARRSRWVSLRATPEKRSELALEYGKVLLLSRVYQGRQALAERARAKRLEQAAIIRDLKARLKQLRSRAGDTSP